MVQELPKASNTLLRSSAYQPDGVRARFICSYTNMQTSQPSQTSLLQDPACNSKLLALCGAGMLSSIATLIHDTYLPVYLQDVLGLSNTRVSTPAI